MSRTITYSYLLQCDVKGHNGSHRTLIAILIARTLIIVYA